MKHAFLTFALLASLTARADFVIVQKVEGATPQTAEMTFKIQETRSRIDVAPQISQLVNAQTGESITLMHNQKRFIKISAEQNQVLRDQMQKLQNAANPKAAETPDKPVATGKMEKVGEWEAEVFTWTNGTASGKYWIARTFPNFPAIQAALAKASGGLHAATKGLAPATSDFPGLAVKTEMKMMGRTITTTIVSVEEKPVTAQELEIPEGYQEMAAPAFNFPVPEAK